MQQAIAILDSGVGGLTVVREVMRQLPQEKIIYFGDTARAPYGPRREEEVVRFTRQIVQYLIQYQPKLIVIACNTATALALQDIREQVQIPVLGVIQPGARAALSCTRSGIIGVIGTENTIKSGAYREALQTISPTTHVISKACPELVPIVEKGLFDSRESRAVVRDSLASLVRYPIDCLILGCTHYPFLSDAISEVMGPDVTLINSAEETARETSAVLYHRGQLAESGTIPVHQLFCSGNADMFKRIARQWLSDYISVTSVVWQVTKL
ncbi:glutamate racemase [Paenibacillus koleovorans]|uniref:glutamate racemase n=1 Tax=Paenibacillus koleovorans TaxID=121608 RepID=UPI000FD72A7C|nr:glutamate racemase [Paenibacillus koleovorans]